MGRNRYRDDDDRDIRRSRRQQEDDDWDPRPESERGRPESYTGLIIGLAIGGGVLVLLVIGVFVIIEATSEPQPPFMINPNVNFQQPRFEMPVQVPKEVPKPAPPPGVPGKPMIDLIPLIDPAKDDPEKNRKWSVRNNVLYCDDGSFVPRIEIPYRPPEEYDFIVTFSQRDLRNGISLIMPKPQGGGSFFWYLGAGNGSEYGFASNPNISGQTPGLIQPSTAYTTTVEVRKNSVRALLGGKELIRHQTDFTDLTCDDWRRIRDTTLLAVACDDPTVFHYVRVVEITGKGKRTR